MRHVNRRFLLAVLGVAALLLSPLAVAEAQKGGKKAMTQPKVVKTILKVDYAIQESNPPNLVVTAVGEVSSGGYTKPTLVRVVYATPPEDGIQDYVLFAVPPDGPAITVISQVKANNTWKAYTKEAPWLKGIRVHGADDGVVVKTFAK